jgi:hypothetical protein
MRCPVLEGSTTVAYLSRLEAKREFYKEYNNFGRLFSHLVKERGVNYMKWFKLFADEEKLRGLGVSFGKLKKRAHK